MSLCFRLLFGVGGSDWIVYRFDVMSCGRASFYHLEKIDVEPLKNSNTLYTVMRLRSAWLGCRYVCAFVPNDIKHPPHPTSVLGDPALWSQCLGTAMFVVFISCSAFFDDIDDIYSSLFFWCSQTILKMFFSIASSANQQEEVSKVAAFQGAHPIVNQTVIDLGDLMVNVINQEAQFLHHITSDQKQYLWVYRSLRYSSWRQMYWTVVSLATSHNA